MDSSPVQLNSPGNIGPRPMVWQKAAVANNQDKNSGKTNPDKPPDSSIQLPRDSSKEYCQDNKSYLLADPGKKRPAKFEIELDSMVGAKKGGSADLRVCMGSRLFWLQGGLDSYVQKNNKNNLITTNPHLGFDLMLLGNTESPDGKGWRLKTNYNLHNYTERTADEVGEETLNFAMHTVNVSTDMQFGPEVLPGLWGSNKAKSFPLMARISYSLDASFANTNSISEGWHTRYNNYYDYEAGQIKQYFQSMYGTKHNLKTGLCLRPITFHTRSVSEKKIAEELKEYAEKINKNETLTAEEKAAAINAKQKELEQNAASLGNFKPRFLGFFTIGHQMQWENPCTEYYMLKNEISPENQFYQMIKDVNPAFNNPKEDSLYLPFQRKTRSVFLDFQYAKKDDLFVISGIKLNYYSNDPQVDKTVDTYFNLRRKITRNIFITGNANIRVGKDIFSGNVGLGLLFRLY